MRYRSFLQSTRSEQNRLGLAVIATLAIVALMTAIVALTQTERGAFDADTIAAEAPPQPTESLDARAPNPAHPTEGAAQ